MMPTEEEKKRFADLCALQHASAEETDGIGRLAEKSVHRLLKCYYDGDFSHHEIKIGKYVADICAEGKITEIQTGSLFSLRKKIEWYLNETDFDVEVVHPIYAHRKIMRVDKETGELLRRGHGLNGRPFDAIVSLSELWDVFPHERLTVTFLFLDVTETRFSEAVRYRKAGKYENLLTVDALTDIVSFHEIGDTVPYLTVPEGAFIETEFYRCNKAMTKSNYWRTFHFLTEKGVFEPIESDEPYTLVMKNGRKRKLRKPKLYRFLLATDGKN